MELTINGRVYETLGLLGHGKGCRRLYPANTNIDYFPTNFVVCKGKLYYVDYECNDYSHKWNYENWGSQYWWKSPAFLEYFAK